MARREPFFRYKGSASRAVERWTQELEKRLLQEKEGLVTKLEKVLDIVEERSQRYIPKDTGAARDSFFREVKVEGNKIIARAGYGADSAEDLDYLVYIHEIEYNNYTTPGTGYRFLARGFEEASLEIDRILSGD